MIIDPSFCLKGPVNVASNAINGGAGVIQLRYKVSSDFEFLDLALKLSKLCRKRRALFLVNDRVDIAMMSGAHGVHLGQNDMPVKEAKKLLKGKIVGVSTHNRKEVLEALRSKADYIGFGPMFETKTKKVLPATVGIKGLRKIRKSVKIPIVAIGGINESNAGEVIEAGADAVAVISAVCGARNVLKATKAIKSRITGI